MRMEYEIQLDYNDVLIRPKRSTLRSREEVELHRSFTFRSSKRSYRGIPIMAANMDGVGTLHMHRSLNELGLFTCMVKHLDAPTLIEIFREHQGEHLAYSLGISESDLAKFEEVKKEVDLEYVCIDVANGYSEHFINFVARFRENNPDITLIAGNVVSGEMTEELILNGADIVKVGIGPGSVCTTRLKTGVGRPQLSAVMECADAAHGLGGHIIADGGCVYPGDVAKAFAAGADFVMLGGMLAGHDEGGGEITTHYYQSGEIDDKGKPKILAKQLISFYGMSSEAANQKHFGGLKDYRSSEGREISIPYRGQVARTVQDILGGLRSTCTYVGASQLKHLSKCASFLRVAHTHNTTYENVTNKM